MRKKILVPTDLSENSKTAIRFAITAARKFKFDLIFFHSVQQVATSLIYADAPVYIYFPDIKKESEHLNKFISSIYHSMQVKQPSYIQCIAKTGDFAGDHIISLAKKLKADLILISATGAGTLQKLIGTTTSYVITNSSVPVLTIPKHFKYQEVEEIIYASDMTNLKKELTQIAGFAEMFGAEINVLHFDYFRGTHLSKTDKDFQSATSKLSYKKITLDYLAADLSSNLAQQIEKYIGRKKTAVLAMFTDQKRTFVQKIISGSKTKAISFYTKVPLLSMKKY